MKLLIALALLLLLVASCTRYEVVNPTNTNLIDPLSTGFNGQTRFNNGYNMSSNWRTNNATFMVTIGGAPYTFVPWFATGDTCTIPSQLHGFSGKTPANGGSWDANDYLSVTDEFTRAFVVDAMYSQNNVLMDGYLNTLLAVNDSGNNYGGVGTGSVLPEWAFEQYYSGGAWHIGKTIVGDNAADANAYAIIGAGIINNTAEYNASVRSKAGAWAQSACLQFAGQNFVNVASSNLQWRHKSGTITYLPKGGSNVGTSISNGEFTYEAYYGPMIDALAVCRGIYGDTGTYNYSKMANDAFSAHLQANQWSSSIFRIGPGLAYHWANISSGNKPYGVCDRECTVDVGNGLQGSNWADSLRISDICRGAFTWQYLVGLPLDNSSTYCAQYVAKSNIYSSNGYSYQFDNLGAGGSPDTGFRGVGLGISLDLMAQSSNIIIKLNQYNSHYANGKMDNQSCFGVYDKSFGLTNAGYGMGLATAALTGNGALGNYTPPPPAGTITIENETINTTAVPVNGAVLINASVGSTTGAISSVLAEMLFPNGSRANYSMTQTFVNVTTSSNESGWIESANDTFTTGDDSWTGGARDAATNTYNASGTYAIFTRDYATASRDVYNITIQNLTYDAASNVEIKYMLEDNGAATSNNYLDITCTTAPTCLIKHVFNNTGYQDCGSFTWLPSTSIKVMVNKTAKTFTSYIDGTLCYAKTTTAFDTGGKFTIVGGNSKISIDNAKYAYLATSNSTTTTSNCTNTTTNTTGFVNLRMNNTFEASAEDWTGNAGWGNAGGDGYINFTTYNTGVSSANISGVANITTNISFNSSVANYTKFFLMSPCGGSNGIRWMLEYYNTTHVALKSDGGSYCDVKIPLNTKVNASFFTTNGTNTTNLTAYDGVTGALLGTCGTQSFGAVTSGSCMTIEGGNPLANGSAAALNVYRVLIYNGTSLVNGSTGNVTTQNCTNTTTNVTYNTSVGTNAWWAIFNATSALGRYNLTQIYATASDSSTANKAQVLNFFVGTNAAPTVTLNTLTQYNFTTSSATLNFTYADAIDTTMACTIYANVSGSFAARATVTASNNTLYSYTTSYSDGTYSWNVLCNDSGSLSAFAAANKTFTINTSTATVGATNITLCTGLSTLRFVPNSSLIVANRTTQCQNAFGNVACSLKIDAAGETSTMHLRAKLNATSASQKVQINGINLTTSYVNVLNVSAGAVQYINVTGCWYNATLAFYPFKLNLSTT